MCVTSFPGASGIGVFCLCEAVEEGAADRMASRRMLFGGVIRGHNHAVMQVHACGGYALREDDGSMQDACDGLSVA